MNIVEVFTRVNGRQPTDQDQRRIIGMANALGANGQDTLICLLIALDHYYGLYDKIPAKIAAEAEAVAGHAAAMAEADIQRLSATVLAEVSEAVQKAAERSAAAAGVRSMVIWIAGAIVVATLSVLGISTWLGARAYQAGYEAGTVELARRDGFAATDTFKKAMKLHEKGYLEDLLTCKRKGWSVKGGICYPTGYKAENGDNVTEGWPVP